MTDEYYDGVIERLRARAATVGLGKNFGYYTDASAKTDIEAADALAAMQVRLGVAENAIDHFDRQQNENEARIAAMEEALEPSGDTKAAYSGEFKFGITLTVFDENAGDDGDGEFVEVQREIMVPWTTIKEIMKAISDRAALKENK